MDVCWGQLTHMGTTSTQEAEARKVTVSLIPDLCLIDTCEPEAQTEETNPESYSKLS